MKENNFEHTRGDTLLITWVVKADWIAMNLTGSVIKFTLREWMDKTKYPVIVEDIATISNPTAWEYEINVSAESMNLECKNYIFDIQLTDSLGQITTISKWTTTITYDIT